MTRVLGAAMLSLLLAAAGVAATPVPARAQGQAETYGAMWTETAAALVAFSAVSAPSMAAAPADGLRAVAPAWRRERDRFERAVVKLIRTVPPQALTALHWKLVPLHEELLGALSTMVEGAEQGDADAVALGRVWARQAQASIARVLRESASSGR